MRLFVALPLPARARDEVAALLARMQDCEWPVRWVRDEGLHLTLKFYGEVAPERLDVIEESIRFAVAGTGPIPLKLDTLGAFPSDRHPRVLWVGLDGPASLEMLQNRLERQGEEIGFPPEGAPFRPHVTLGRVREGHRLPTGALGGMNGTYERVAFLAEEVVLYESLLAREGPRYEARSRLSLVE